MTEPQRLERLGTNSTEEWRPVAGYEGYYEVSSLGGVRSVGRWITRRGQYKPIWFPPTVIRGSDVKGYHYVTFSRNSKVRPFAVHVMVCKAFYGKKPTPAHEVRHLNGDRWDNRVENLRWGTHRENMQDTLIHGTAAYLNRTHCKQGHEFTPENTYNQPMPKRRVCRECQRLARLKHNAKRQAQKEAA